MFASKNKYFFIIENTKDINLNNIKKHNKFFIIYRPNILRENLAQLVQFKKKCNLKSIKFYIANDLGLCVETKADGIYLSSSNNSFRALNFKRQDFDIIGSAHNYKEIKLKDQQGCNFILFSKLFLVNYDKKSPYLGVIRFNNLINQTKKKIIALGGINSNNLNMLKILNCYGFALMSEVKKKPAIIDRLF